DLVTGVQTCALPISEGRKQVRIQLKNGADFIKIYAAGIRANPDIGYGAPTMTLEEEQAIVDEAHRQGVRVACTAHAGVAVRQSRSEERRVGKGGRCE